MDRLSYIRYLILHIFHGCTSPISCLHAINVLFYRSKHPWASRASSFMKDNLRDWKPHILYLSPSTHLFLGKSVDHLLNSSFFSFLSAFEGEKQTYLPERRVILKLEFCSPCLQSELLFTLIIAYVPSLMSSNPGVLTPLEILLTSQLQSYLAVMTERKPSEFCL